MFSDYCNNHGNADSLVAGLLKKNSAFRQFIEVCIHIQSNLIINDYIQF